MSVSQMGQLPYELVCLTGSFLSGSEIVRLGGVSQRWYNALADEDFCNEMSTREGVPRVEGAGRDRRREFCILYPMAIKGVRPSDVERVFGCIVKTVNKLSEASFNRIISSPEIRNNFVPVDFPSAIQFHAGASRKLGEDELRELRGATDVGEGITEYPLSLWNMRVLRPELFDGNSYRPAFDKCEDRPPAGLFVMGETVPENTRHKTWDEQAALMKAQCFVATSLAVRTLLI